MTFNRPWLALFLAGCCCASLPAASAQEAAGAASSFGGLGGGLGGFGADGTSGSSPGAGAGSGFSFGSGLGTAPATGGTNGTGTSGTGTSGTGTSGTGTSGTGTSGTGTSGTGTSGTGTSGTGTSGTGTSGTGTSGTGVAPGGNTSGLNGTPSSLQGSGASSLFGNPFSGGTTGTNATSPTTTTGAGTQTGLEGFGPSKVPPVSAPSFSLPGFYGTSGSTLIAGEGRLAKPRFEYTASTSMGYDDNVFQTPTHSKDIAPVFVEVVVSPAVPASIEYVPVFRTVTEFAPFGGAGSGQTISRQEFVRFDPKFIAGTPAQTRKVLVFPGQAASERTGSALSQVSGGANVQFFSRRTLFTFDLNGSASRYWNRPSDPNDFNGAAVFNFLYRLTPRLQFTALYNGAYLNQPDLSRINTPLISSNQDYFTSNAKLDLTYRWTPRLSTVLSLSQNRIFYQARALQSGDYAETTFGTEVNYLWNAVFTALSEARYSTVTYSESSVRDAHTIFGLIGMEARMSKRFSGSLRVGLSMRTFEDTGDSASTPYMEATLAYRVGPASNLSWNSRFGFEEPGAVGEQRRVFRNGLNYSQAFSPRLSLVLGGNFLYQTISTAASPIDFSTTTYDASARLEYRLTKKFSLNTSLSYTRQDSELKTTDYYRTRYFLGGEYTF